MKGPVKELSINQVFRGINREVSSFFFQVSRFLQVFEGCNEGRFASWIKWRSDLSTVSDLFSRSLVPFPAG